MITRFSDRVRDAPIEKLFLRELASINFAGRLRAASGRAGNACCGVEPERFTVPNTNYLFATDTCGTETIAEGSSGKRLRLSASRTSGE